MQTIWVRGTRCTLTHELIDLDESVALAELRAVSFDQIHFHPPRLSNCRSVWVRCVYKYKNTREKTVRTTVSSILSIAPKQNAQFGFPFTEWVSIEVAKHMPEAAVRRRASSQQSYDFRCVAPMIFCSSWLKLMQKDLAIEQEHSQTQEGNKSRFPIQQTNLKWLDIPIH
jgi:hypothetical protein